MYIMKLKLVHIGLIVFLVLVSIFIIMSPKSVKPYSQPKLFSIMYNYEGMENNGADIAALPPPPQQSLQLPPQSLQQPPPPPQPPVNSILSAISSITGQKAASENKREGNSKMVEGLSSQPPVNSILSAINSITGQNGASEKREGNSKMVEGFSLQPAPFNGSIEIDRYSKVSSSPSCFGKSSGYSNSTGPLCLEGDSLTLLTTRGGNSTGSDSTIGH